MRETIAGEIKFAREQIKGYEADVESEQPFRGISARQLVLWKEELDKLLKIAEAQG